MGAHSRRLRKAGSAHFCLRISINRWFSITGQDGHVGAQDNSKLWLTFCIIIVSNPQNTFSPFVLCTKMARRWRQAKITWLNNLSKKYLKGVFKLSLMLCLLWCFHKGITETMDNYFQGMEYLFVTVLGNPPTLPWSTLVRLLFVFEVLEIFRVIIERKTSIQIFMYLYLAVMFKENSLVIGRMYCGGEILTENLGRTEMQWNEICISEGSIIPK